MVEIDDTRIKVGAGLFLFVLIAAFLIVPYAFPADTIILTNPQGGTPVSCLPTGGLVLAQNLTDLCDVTIISPLTTQIIEYNGTQWVNVNVSQVFNDTTTCGNIGTGTAFLCVEGTNLDLRSLLAGTGISVSNNTNTITITNTAPDNTVCANLGTWGEGVYANGECNFRRIIVNGTGSCLTSDFDSNSTNIVIQNICTYNADNLGSVGEGVWASVTNNYPDFVQNFKKLLAGSGISLSANGTRITFTNTLPEATACNNVGTGNQLCSGGNVNIDTLIAGTGITITDTTDDWTFASQCANTGTGEAVCESSNNINSLIAGTDISITDTTGDLTIASTNLIKLCEANASGGETSLQCSLASTPQFFQFNIYFESSSTDTWQLRLNADSGNNYAQRSSTNGGADGTSTSTSSLASVAVSTNQGYHYFFQCDNPASGKEKHCYGFRTTSATGAGNADARVEFASKWANTAANVSTVDLVRTAGTGTLNSGAYIIVFGVA